MSIKNLKYLYQMYGDKILKKIVNKMKKRKNVLSGYDKLKYEF